MSGEDTYRGIAEHGADRPAGHLTLAEDDTERQLASIWRETLGLESIGIDQNYFDLGGDSSLAVRIFAEIEKVFKVKLPLATLYETPTIEQLARVLHRNPAGRHSWQSSQKAHAFLCFVSTEPAETF